MNWDFENLWYFDQNELEIRDFNRNSKTERFTTSASKTNLSNINVLKRNQAYKFIIQVNLNL